MKRMELKIALTFAIMFVVGVIIHGLYSVLSLGESFFSFGIMASAMINALFYLVYIWMNTRRHRLLAVLGVLSVGLFMIFASYSSDGNAGIFSSCDWRDAIMIVYYIISFEIAAYQSKKLLEEDRKIKNTITPEETLK